MTDAPPPYPGIYGAWAPPQGAGAMAAPQSQMNGFTSNADAKAAEAAASGTVQTGYYDPTNPQTAYIPPGTVKIEYHISFLYANTLTHSDYILIELFIIFVSL